MDRQLAKVGRPPGLHRACTSLALEVLLLSTAYDITQSVDPRHRAPAERHTQGSGDGSRPWPASFHAVITEPMRTHGTRRGRCHVAGSDGRRQRPRDPERRRTEVE